MSQSEQKTTTHLNRTDLLAIDRTRLANERTFLAYFRTFIVFLGSGFAIVKMQVLQEVREVGYILIFVSPLLLLIGWLRYRYTKKRLRKYFSESYHSLLK
jgi:putative membrane protein